MQFVVPGVFISCIDENLTVSDILTILALAIVLIPLEPKSNMQKLKEKHFLHVHSFGLPNSQFSGPYKSMYICLHIFYDITSIDRL